MKIRNLLVVAFMAAVIAACGKDENQKPADATKAANAVKQETQKAAEEAKEAAQQAIEEAKKSAEAAAATIENK